MNIIATQQDVDFALRQLVLADSRLEHIRAQVNHVALRRASAGFNSLAWIIVSQHVSTASARAIWRRFEEHIIPLTPQQYLDAGDDVWRAIGLSRPKQKTFWHLCEAIESGHLNLDALQIDPIEDALKQLTRLHGIGPWTAEVYMLVAQGAADVFPAGDVALQSAVQSAFGLDLRPDEKKLRVMAEKWAPYRSVAALLFWAYYAVINGRDAAPLATQ